MNIKQHLCGVAVAYEQFTNERREGPSFPSDTGRPNGSLYNRQKRSIADACAYLHMKLKGNKDRKPVIFCLTSPGYVSTANTPKFISCFVENMRANYGMGEYVWVREHTKRGYPHFHFIAEWNTSKWFFEEVTAYGQRMPRINAISRYWSGLFERDDVNSVRLGSYHPATNKRTIYVSSEKHWWYLTKYVGKNIGDNGHCNYLCEAGFPATKYKKSVRSFAISEKLREWCEPVLFKMEYVDTATGDVVSYIMSDDFDNYRFRSIHRSWKNTQVNVNDWREEILTEDDLNRYRWKWTGHGNTYMGYEKRSFRTSRPRKGGNKSD